MIRIRVVEQFITLIRTYVCKIFLRNKNVYTMTIKDYCTSKNITFTQLAKLIPCAPQYISMISGGKAKPGYKMAKRIENVTDGQVTISELIPDE